MSDLVDNPVVQTVASVFFPTQVLPFATAAGAKKTADEISKGLRPPNVVIPTPPDRAAAAQAAEEERRRRINASGQSSTILTGGAGVEQAALTGSAALLGT